MNILMDNYRPTKTAPTSVFGSRYNDQIYDIPIPANNDNTVKRMDDINVQRNCRKSGPYQYVPALDECSRVSIKTLSLQYFTGTNGTPMRTPTYRYSTYVYCGGFNV